MAAVKQAFQALSDATDIFNLGRLIFYTAAGALVVYPAAAGVTALAGAPSGDPVHDLVVALGCLHREHEQALIAASIVAGFVIAGLGFALVLESISPRVKASAESKPIDRRCYPYRYPQLANTDGENYDNWLIREYFRFVEIVTYVPLGLLGGLASVTLYAGAYVVVWSASGHGIRFAPPHGTLVAAAVLFALTAFGIWPFFWVPRVVAPVLEAYHRAKLALVAALDERKPTPMPAPPKPDASGSSS